MAKRVQSEAKQAAVQAGRDKRIQNAQRKAQALQSAEEERRNNALGLAQQLKNEAEKTKASRVALLPELEEKKFVATETPSGLQFVAVGKNVEVPKGTKTYSILEINEIWNNGVASSSSDTPKPNARNMNKTSPRHDGTAPSQTLDA